MSDQAVEARARARATWAAGHWDEVSKMLPPAGQRVIELAEVQEGMDVVDVGCGSGGTLSIPCAQRGANVVGVDIAPEHFADARRRAQEAGVSVDWIEGDAADLPLDEGRFDRVLSTFGHAFAADHAAAGRELVRVCRPGGRIAVAMWTPEGANGEMFRVVGGHMPAPPPGFQPPVLWGTEAHWEELVGAQGVELEFHREMLVMEYESPERFLADFEQNFGPLVMARAILGDAWGALHDDLLTLYRDQNQATDGTFRGEAEYLVAVGRKPG